MTIEEYIELIGRGVNGESIRANVALRSIPADEVRAFLSGVYEDFLDSFRRGRPRKRIDYCSCTDEEVYHLMYVHALALRRKEYMNDYMVRRYRKMRDERANGASKDSGIFGEGVLDGNVPGNILDGNIVDGKSGPGNDGPVGSVPDGPDDSASSVNVHSVNVHSVNVHSVNAQARTGFRDGGDIMKAGRGRKAVVGKARKDPLERIFGFSDLVCRKIACVNKVRWDSMEMDEKVEAVKASGLPEMSAGSTRRDSLKTLAELCPDRVGRYVRQRLGNKPELSDDGAVVHFRGEAVDPGSLEFPVELPVLDRMARLSYVRDVCAGESGDRHGRAANGKGGQVYLGDLPIVFETLDDRVMSREERERLEPGQSSKCWSPKWRLSADGRYRCGKRMANGCVDVSEYGGADVCYPGMMEFMWLMWPEMCSRGHRSYVVEADVEKSGRTGKALFRGGAARPARFFGRIEEPDLRDRLSGLHGHERNEARKALLAGIPASERIRLGRRGGSCDLEFSFGRILRNGLEWGANGMPLGPLTVLAAVFGMVKGLLFYPSDYEYTLAEFTRLTGGELGNLCEEGPGLSSGNRKCMCQFTGAGKVVRKDSGMTLRDRFLKAVSGGAPYRDVERLMEEAFRDCDFPGTVPAKPGKERRGKKGRRDAKLMRKLADAYRKRIDGNLPSRVYMSFESLYATYGGSISGSDWAEAVKGIVEQLRWLESHGMVSPVVEWPNEKAADYRQVEVRPSFLDGVDVVWENFSGRRMPEKWAPLSDHGWIPVGFTVRVAGSWLFERVFHHRYNCDVWLDNGGYVPSMDSRLNAYRMGRAIKDYWASGGSWVGPDGEVRKGLSRDEYARSRGSADGGPADGGPADGSLSDMKEGDGSSNGDCACWSFVDDSDILERPSRKPGAVRDSWIYPCLINVKPWERTFHAAGNEAGKKGRTGRRPAYSLDPSLRKAAGPIASLVSAMSRAAMWLHEREVSACFRLGKNVRVCVDAAGMMRRLMGQFGGSRFSAGPGLDGRDVKFSVDRKSDRWRVDFGDATDSEICRKAAWFFDRATADYRKNGDRSDPVVGKHAAFKSLYTAEDRRRDRIMGVNACIGTGQHGMVTVRLLRSMRKGGVLVKTVLPGRGARTVTWRRFQKMQPDFGRQMAAGGFRLEGGKVVEINRLNRRHNVTLGWERIDTDVALTVRAQWVPWRVREDGTLDRGPAADSPFAYDRQYGPGGELGEEASCGGGRWEIVPRSYGRNYSGSRGFQRIPKRLRPMLRIDGEDAMGVDYSALHFNMLLSMHGMEPGGDLYDVGRKWGEGMGLAPEEERRAVKLMCQIMLNSRNSRQADEAFRIRWNESIGRRRDEPVPFVKRLAEAIKSRHPSLRRHFYGGAGVKLQYLDGCLIRDACLDLARMGECALIMHDELIVRESAAGLAKKVMERRYREMFRHGITARAKDG